MSSEPIRPAAFITHPPRRVVFLCIANSARSQMAEGFARRRAPADAEVWSAGLEPGTIHPLSIEVMSEAGIDIRDQRAKGVADIPLAEADTVVTLCGEADEVCPAVGADVRRVHWPLPDPARAPEAERLAAFREIRDEIRWRVAALWPGVD